MTNVQVASSSKGDPVNYPVDPSLPGGLAGCYLAAIILMGVVDAMNGVQSAVANLLDKAVGYQSDASSAMQEALTAAIAKVTTPDKGKTVQQETALYQDASTQWNAIVQKYGTNVDLLQSLQNQQAQASQEDVQLGQAVISTIGFNANLYR